jgi:poly-gamma-glutamate synthesis protein (capsule biosynthesis protein)
MYIEISKKKGVNALTKKAVQKALNDDIYKKSFSILSFHWGDEYSHLPNKTQIELCRELSDKYNFIIQGHHTHVMQGVEKIKNSLIAYSQGNFYFEDIQSEVNSKLQVRQSAITREGFILGVEILNTEITDWRIIGIRREEERISIINNFDKIKTISEKINDYKNAEYEKEAKSMIISQKKSNRGNHDFKWFMSKLNYYSIGAELKSHLYKKKYDRAYK